MPSAFPKARTQPSGVDDNLPKYLRIARELQSEIERDYQPGDYLPSTRAMQTRFQVTLNTIQAVLGELAQRGVVETLPYKGTVVLPSAKRSLVSLSTQRRDAEPHRVLEGKTVALVMPLKSYLVNSLTRDAEREVRQRGGRLQLSSTSLDWAMRSSVAQPHGRMKVNAEHRHEAEVLQSLGEQNIAGVLWWSNFAMENGPLALHLVESGIPVVMMDKQLPHSPLDCVSVDDRGAAYRATQHLLQKGHRHLLFYVTLFEGTVNSVQRERMLGFFEALSTHHLLEPDDYFALEWARDNQDWASIAEKLSERARQCVYIHPYPETASAQEQLREMKTHFKRISGLVAFSDHEAYSLLHMAEKAGVAVPDELAMVSFGDINQNSKFAPFLTSVFQPFGEIGRRAVQLLAQRLAQPAMPFQHIYLPTELRVRQSCGGPVQSQTKESL